MQPFGLSQSEFMFTPYRFLPFIFKDLFHPKREAIRHAKYISIMADSSTDSSVKDLESMYVRYLVNGQPMNTFIGIEELEHVHAQGHKEAIEQGTF